LVHSFPHTLADACSNISEILWFNGGKQILNFITPCQSRNQFYKNIRFTFFSPADGETIVRSQSIKLQRTTLTFVAEMKIRFQSMSQSSVKTCRTTQH
jgi:hypothetical protein